MRMQNGHAVVTMLGSISRSCSVRRSLTRVWAGSSSSYPYLSLWTQDAILPPNVAIAFLSFLNTYGPRTLESLNPGSLDESADVVKWRVW